MTVDRRRAGAPSARFSELLLAMDYADPEVRPLLDLEGLKPVGAGTDVGLRRPSSRPSTTAGFYDAQGRITAADYRP